MLLGYFPAEHNLSKYKVVRVKYTPPPPMPHPGSDATELAKHHLISVRHKFRKQDL